MVRRGLLTDIGVATGLIRGDLGAAIFAGLMVRVLRVSL